MHFYITNAMFVMQRITNYWGTSSSDPIPGLRPWTLLGDHTVCGVKKILRLNYG